jgi:uncharacterized membrane-anchored protein
VIERLRSTVDRLAAYWLALVVAAVTYGTGLAVTHDPVAGLFIAVALAVFWAAITLPVIAWYRTRDQDDHIKDLNTKYTRLCQYVDNRAADAEARVGAVEKRVGMNRFGLPDQRRTG